LHKVFTTTVAVAGRAKTARKANIRQNMANRINIAAVSMKFVLSRELKVVLVASFFTELV